MEKAPRKTAAREVAEAAVTGVAGMVPVAGSPVAAALMLALGWSLNKRTQAWLDELAETVEELQAALDATPSLEELGANDVFLDAVVAATRVAQATHLEEKREALRNGVFNSLGPEAPNVDQQARFFRLVDEFSPTHLKLLRFFKDPGAVFDAEGVERPNLLSSGRASVLELVWPVFVGQRDWYDLLTADLERAGLVAGSGLHVTMSGGGVWQSSTTDLGNRFFAFVTR